MDVFLFFLVTKRGFGEFKVVAKFGFLQTKALDFQLFGEGSKNCCYSSMVKKLFHLSSLSFVPPLCR